MALSYLNEAIRLNPNYTKAYNNRGNIYTIYRKTKKAISDYKKALSLPNEKRNFPNEKYQPSSVHTAAHNSLGNALRKKGNLEEAITHYQQAIQLDPDFAEAYNNLGATLQQQGKLEEASTHYQQAIQLNSNFIIAKNNLKKAERQLTSNIDDPKFPPSKFNEPLVDIKRSTVRIIAQIPDPNSLTGETTSSNGAGWVVKKEGNTIWIVTNRHVISDRKKEKLSRNIEVEFFRELPDGKIFSYPAKIITSSNRYDSQLDLAVLKVTDIPDDIQVLKMSSERGQTGTIGRIIGHPASDKNYICEKKTLYDGDPICEVDNNWSVLQGEVVEVAKDNPNNLEIYISESFAQGYSGGPIVDNNNQVIGMMISFKDILDRADEIDLANLNPNQLATGDIGIAHRIDVVREKLREWGIID